MDQPIIFCIDRKAVIDVLEEFPTAYREKQDALHLDTLNQIQEILKQRTANIQFKHVYSHTNENMEDLEKQDSNLKKKEKMYNKYGEKRAERYVYGNMKADKITDKAMEIKDLPKAIFNPYQNEFILQNMRKKKTKKNLDKSDVMNTRIRKTIKKQLEKILKIVL